MRRGPTPELEAGVGVGARDGSSRPAARRRGDGRREKKRGVRVKTERRDKDQGVRRKEKKCVEKVEKNRSQ